MSYSTLAERFQALDPWMKASAASQARVWAFVITWAILAVWHLDSLLWAATYYLGLLGLWLYGDFGDRS